MNGTFAYSPMTKTQTAFWSMFQVKSSRGEQVFEIRIDGKLVCAKRRGKAGVFLRMETVEQVCNPSTFVVDH